MGKRVQEINLRDEKMWKPSKLMGLENHYDSRHGVQVSYGISIEEQSSIDSLKETNTMKKTRSDQMIQAGVSRKP